MLFRSLAGRRVQVRLSPREVVVHLEGGEIGRHRRSFAPADVVLDPRHARALRLAREARSRLVAGDVALEAVDLSRYDALSGVSPARWVASDVQPGSENGSPGLLEAPLPAGVG